MYYKIDKESYDDDEDYYNEENEEDDEDYDEKYENKSESELSNPFPEKKNKRKGM